MLFDDPTQDGFLISKKQMAAIYREAADRDLQRLDRIAAMERARPDFDVESSRRPDIIMAWCYRLLAGRDETAKVDDVAKRKMTATGLTEADCDEVDYMLDGLRAQHLVPHHPDRLRAFLDAVGACHHDGNARVAQAAIYLGYAEALGQTGRRWDGMSIKDDHLLEGRFRY